MKDYRLLTILSLALGILNLPIIGISSMQIVVAKNAYARLAFAASIGVACAAAMTFVATLKQDSIRKREIRTIQNDKLRLTDDEISILNLPKKKASELIVADVNARKNEFENDIEQIRDVNNRINSREKSYFILGSFLFLLAATFLTYAYCVNI